MEWTRKKQIFSKEIEIGKLKDGEGGDGDKSKVDKSEKSYQAKGIISSAVGNGSRTLPPNSSSKTKVLSVSEQGTTTLEQLSNDRGGSLSSPVSTAANNPAKRKNITSSSPYRKRNLCSDVRVSDITSSNIMKQTHAAKKRAQQSTAIKFIPESNTPEIISMENKNNDDSDLTSDLTPAQRIKWSNLPPPIWDDINRAKKEWRNFPHNHDWGYIPPSLDGIDKTKVSRLGTAGIHFALGNEGLIKIICQFGPKHAPIFPTDSIVTITTNDSNKINSKNKKLQTSNSKMKRMKRKDLSSETESSTNIVRSHNYKSNPDEYIGSGSIMGLRKVIDVEETKNKVNEITDPDMKSNKLRFFETIGGGSIVDITQVNKVNETENKANKIMDSDMKTNIAKEHYSNIDCSAFHEQNLFEAAVSVSSPCASIPGRYDDNISAGYNLNINSDDKARRRPFEVTVKAGPKHHHSQTLIYSSGENLHDISLYDAIERAYWMQKARLVFLHDGARKGKLMHLKYTNSTEKSMGIISSNRWQEINLGELREVVQNNAILLEVELVDKSEFYSDAGSDQY